LVLGVFLIVFERRRERLAALALALAGLAANWAGYALTGEPRLVGLVLRHCLVSAFLSFGVAVILRGLFQQRAIHLDHVVGAFCGYLITGVVWGNLYLLAEDVFPDSYDVKPAIAWQLREEHTRRFLFNYFSFVTLTTLGYGDITPVRPFASALVVLEAVFGQFYVAVVVAQLVGLSLARALQKEDSRSA
jgi:hypothetical protein